MVRIDRVHTGGGNDGESSLVDGSRRSKSDARFSVVGDVQMCLYLCIAR